MHDVNSRYHFVPNFKPMIPIKIMPTKTMLLVEIGSLSINKPYQGLGWSKKLKNECHEIIKDYGFNYVMSIIKRDNFKSKNLLMGLGYKKHLSNEDRYFLYFKL